MEPLQVQLLRVSFSLGVMARKRTGALQQDLVWGNIQDNIIIVIYKALCFVVAQGRMNGAPNETRTHSRRFASLAC